MTMPPFNDGLFSKLTGIISSSAWRAWFSRVHQFIFTMSGGTGTPISPSATVVTETAYNQASAAGAALTFSRGDHTHGSPSDANIPTAAQKAALVGTGTPSALDPYVNDSDLRLADLWETVTATPWSVGADVRGVFIDDTVGADVIVLLPATAEVGKSVWINSNRTAWATTIKNSAGSPLYSMHAEQLIRAQYTGLAWPNDWDIEFTVYPGGVDTNVQFNDLGVLGGDAHLTFDKTTDLLTMGGPVDWSAGNVTYVPLAGDIQTYVTAATAGDTLILASGVYTITALITISKQINIVGQGRSGFVTGPVTPSHGTLITSSVALPTGAFKLNNDNIRLANFSINLTGAGSLCIDTANNLRGLVLENIDVIVACTGYAQGFTVYGSSMVMRNDTFYITSTNNSAHGLWVWNDASTTLNAIIDCFNVTGTVVGVGAGSTRAFACENINVAQTITLNLDESICKALAGTASDVAVLSTSTTTNNAIVNAYMCTLDGQDFDAMQTGTNQLNLGGSVIVNNLVSGTVTYRAAIAAGEGVFGGDVTCATLHYTTLDPAIPATVPGGLNTHVQYNNAGAFGGNASLTYDGAGTMMVATKVTTPRIKVVADSAAAFKITRADDAAWYLSIDTSSSRMGFGLANTNPSYTWHFRQSSSPQAVIQSTTIAGAVTISFWNNMNTGLSFTTYGSGYPGTYYGINYASMCLIRLGANCSGLIMETYESFPICFGTNATERARFIGTGQFGLGVTAPTAILHLKAGTTAASSAPLKFTSGTSLTVAEAGAMEFTTDDLFFTITTGPARKRLLMADPVAGLTTTRIPYATTNGRLTDTAALAYDGTYLLAGAARLGDASNYVQVTAAGATSLVGTARVKQEIKVPITTIYVPGADAPARETLPVVDNIEVPTLAFDPTVATDEEVFFEVHMPTDVCSAVVCDVNLIWIPDPGFVQSGAESYVWKLEYIVKDEASAVLALTAGSQTTRSATETPASCLYVKKSTVDTGIAALAGQIIYCRLYLDASESTSDDDAHLIAVEVSYTADKLGETT